MRIISGIHKGRTITAPSGLPVRPTTDFAKTGLFNILSHKINFNEIKLLDLFSGTGNISYEFASRGCSNILAVDTDNNCVKFIRSTFDKLNITGAEVVRSDVFRYLQAGTEKFDVIFADPPYDMLTITRIPQLVSEKQLLNEGGMLILEHASNLKQQWQGTTETRIYGHVAFTFFYNFNS